MAHFLCLAQQAWPLAEVTPLPSKTSGTVLTFYIFINSHAEHEGMISHAFAG